MGLFDEVKRQAAAAAFAAANQAGAAIANKKEEILTKNETLASITVSTTTPLRPYKVLEVIFDFDSHQAGFFSGGKAKPSVAFEKVTENLKNICFKMGGDAVVGCQFEYRVAVGESIFGSNKQVIEIFAYGTVISYLD